MCASTRRGIASVSKGYKIIVEKSTVPVKTAEAVEKVLKTCCDSSFTFDVLSNPEFLAEVRPPRTRFGFRPQPTSLAIRRHLVLLVVREHVIPMNHSHAIVLTSIGYGHVVKVQGVQTGGLVSFVQVYCR